jgi:hypothetical protein
MIEWMEQHNILLEIVWLIISFILVFCNHRFELYRESGYPQSFLEAFMADMRMPLWPLLLPIVLVVGLVLFIKDHKKEN